MKTSRLLTKGCYYIVMALADRYITKPLPLKRNKNLELLEHQGSKGT